MKKLLVLALALVLVKSAHADLISGTIGAGSGGSTNAAGSAGQIQYNANGTAFGGAAGTFVTGSSVTLTKPWLFSNGINQGINTVTASYTITSTDTVVAFNCGVTGCTGTLPSATTDIGQMLILTKVDATTGPVTLRGAGSDVMEGTGTVVLNAKNQTAQIIADGAGHWIPQGQGIQFTPSYLSPKVPLGNSGNGLNVSSQVVCEALDVTVPVAVSSLTVWVVTQGAGNMDIGLYDNSGNLIASAGATAVPAAGRAALPMTTIAHVPPGIYWECMVTGQTTPTFESLTWATTTPPGEQVCAAASTNVPLPATLAFPCTGASRLVSYDMWAPVVGGQL